METAEDTRRRDGGLVKPEQNLTVLLDWRGIAARNECVVNKFWWRESTRRGIAVKKWKRALGAEMVAEIAPM